MGRGLEKTPKLASVPHCIKDPRVPAILNSGTWFAAVPPTKTHFSDKFNWRLISQLINGISSVLQKLLRYFNVVFIPTFFFGHRFLFVLLFSAKFWAKYY